MFDRPLYKRLAKDNLNYNLWRIIALYFLSVVITTLLYLVIVIVIPAFSIAWFNYLPFGSAFITILLYFIIFGLIFAFFLEPLIFYLNLKYHLYIAANENKAMSLSVAFKNFDLGSYFFFALKIFVANLFIALWSIFFVIPGIYKFFSYFLVPFIAIDKPELGILETLRESKELTRGYKMNIFILLLSFIPWCLLVPFTLGLISLWLVPYISLTLTNMYFHLAYPLDDQDYVEEDVYIV